MDKEAGLRVGVGNGAESFCFEGGHETRPGYPPAPARFALSPRYLHIGKTWWRTPRQIPQPQEIICPPLDGTTYFDYPSLNVNSESDKTQTGQFRNEIETGAIWDKRRELEPICPPLLCHYWRANNLQACLLIGV